MRKLVVLSSTLFMCSCASFEAMQQQWATDNCNQDAAYANGMNDARKGKDMNSYSAQCPAERQAEVRQGYNSGYTSGLQSMHSDQPTINLSIGGDNTNSNKGWFCELSVFAKGYHAFGRTQLEARQKVKDRCSADNNAIHCDNADCKINQ